MNIREKFRKKKKKKRIITKLTFSKVWVGRLLWMSVFDIQLSYILAFMGREQIAEKLAIAIVANIIFVIIPYLAKSFFETREEEKNKLIYNSRLYNNLEYLDENENEEESMR